MRQLPSSPHGGTKGASKMVHWLNNIWFDYFWPSLKSNGPEALVQTVLYAAIAFIFVPPVRRYVNAHVKSLHDKLDMHHEEHMKALGVKKRGADGRFK